MERKTQQRQAILKVLEDTSRPLSVQEIHDYAKKHSRRIGIATVYRNLKYLVDDGILSSLELPGGFVLYEFAEAEHHHHFSCVECSKVFDVEGCNLDLKRMTPKGFKLQGHDLLMSGLCNRCAK